VTAAQSGASVPSVVPFLSGGTGSWCATRRYIDQHGPEGVVCLFTDVGDGSPHVGEDEDTYRFLDDAIADLGVPLIRIQDGRNIWDVFEEKRWLGNSNLSHCSWELKTKPAKAWVDANCDPATTKLLVGIDWIEGDRRLPAIRKNWAPFEVIAPLTERPLLGKLQMRRMLTDRGLRGPRLTEQLGMAHANCIACVKGGQGHWKQVLDLFPEHFRYAEEREQDIRADLGDVSILKDRAGGDSRPLTLRDFREREQAGGIQVDLFDLGGCGCMAETEPRDVA
jgi:hypothetical protein